MTRFIAYQRKTADAIAAAIRNSGVPHVVLLSSVGADLPEGTGALKGLHYLENVVRATGVRLVAIRPGYFQENIASWLAPARAPNGLNPLETPMGSEGEGALGHRLTGQSLG